MIKQTAYRYNQGERLSASRPYGDPMNSGDRTIAKAMVALVRYELSYGGTIVALEPTMVNVKTQVLGTVDHTVFEGTEEDMLPIMKFLAVYFTIVENVDAKAEYAKVFDKLSEDFGGTRAMRPLVLTVGGPMMVGASLTRKAIVGYLSETEQDVHMLIKADANNLYSFLESKLDGSLSMDDIRLLAA